MAKNYFAILGVTTASSADEIRSAYRRLAKEYHPDHFEGGSEIFRQIQEAYMVLGNALRRSAYEEALTVKPTGKEAIENMATAKTLKTNREKEIARQETYDNAIRIGDMLFAEKNYELSKVEFEKAFVEKKLLEFKGNISQTAEAIGVERSNLHKKIKAYKLDGFRSQ